MSFETPPQDDDRYPEDILADIEAEERGEDGQPTSAITEHDPFSKRIADGLSSIHSHHTGNFYKKRSYRKPPSAEEDQKLVESEHQAAQEDSEHPEGESE